MNCKKSSGKSKRAARGKKGLWLPSIVNILLLLLAVFVFIIFWWLLVGDEIKAGAAAEDTSFTLKTDRELLSILRTESSIEGITIAELIELAYYDNNKGEEYAKILERDVSATLDEAYGEGNYGFHARRMEYGLGREKELEVGSMRSEENKFITIGGMGAAEHVAHAFLPGRDGTMFRVRLMVRKE